MGFRLRNQWPIFTAHVSFKGKPNKHFWTVTLMDSLHFPGQKEMTFNTKGTGTWYLDFILQLEIPADSDAVQ